MIREKERKILSGYLMIVVLFLAEAATIYWFVQELQAISISGIITSAIAMIVVFVLWFGYRAGADLVAWFNEEILDDLRGDKGQKR